MISYDVCLSQLTSLLKMTIVRSTHVAANVVISFFSWLSRDLSHLRLMSRVMITPRATPHPQCPRELTRRAEKHLWVCFSMSHLPPKISSVPQNGSVPALLGVIAKTHNPRSTVHITPKRRGEALKPKTTSRLFALTENYV